MLSKSDFYELLEKSSLTVHVDFYGSYCFCLCGGSRIVEFFDSRICSSFVNIFSEDEALYRIYKSVILVLHGHV